MGIRGHAGKLAEAYPQSELAAQGTLRAADFLVSQGKGEEAKSELTKMVSASSLEPYHSRMQKKLAEILKAEGHLKEAVFYFQQALKKAPDELKPEIESELSEAYALQGRVPTQTKN